MTKQMVRTYIDSVTHERDELKKQNAELIELVRELSVVSGLLEVANLIGRAQQLLDNIPDKLVDQQR
jgi:hypothetical protein